MPPGSKDKQDLIDWQLVEKYNKPGPRYTSYPTAPEWRNVTAQEADTMVRGVGESPLSLYVHIPFCREICHFCGCYTFAVKKQEYVDEYLDALISEMATLRSKLATPSSVVQMHWGGGTPTHLSPSRCARLLDAIDLYFDVDPQGEIAIEIDPRVTTEEQLALLRRRGFNRVSFGVQDFDLTVQKAINRVQTKEETKHLYDVCRDLGFESINIDLVYGLPHQTVENFLETVDTIIDWRPDRIALFSYAHVPWMKPYQKMIHEPDLPSPVEKFTTFMESRAAFLQAGFEAVGMDHFALPGDELTKALKKKQLRRNFMGYTVLPENTILAFGASAISDFNDAYLQNAKKLNAYAELTKSGRPAGERGCVLSLEDRLRKHVITDIMCNFHVNVAEVEKRFNCRFFDAFEWEIKALEDLQLDGLVKIDNDSVEVTSLGKIFVRNVAMVFDQYLRARKDKTEQVFSKTI